MTKFLIGILTGIILTGLILVIVLFAALQLRDSQPAVASGSTLVLRLEGEIPERAPVTWPFPLPFVGESKTLTVENVWSALRKAAADKRINAVILEPQGLDIGWAKLQEIRTGVENFRKSGKPVYAFLRRPGTREYYLATAADRIYLSPSDLLYVKGLRSEAMYFRNTLAKLGVDVTVVHAGKYKDFGDMFTQTSMSPETREVLNSLLDEIYGHLVGTIAAARKKTPEQVRALIDNGPYTSGQVPATGLVDKVAFEDELIADLKQRLKVKDIKRVTGWTYRGVPASSAGIEGKHRIGLLVGEGAITRGDSDSDGMSSDGLESAGFVKLLRRAGADNSLKGVVVRIDSPGGEVMASDEIWREMNLLRKKKPVVISMSDSAASGGYYMAMTGDPIVAYPGTFTGSIGVVFVFPTLRGLYDKLGITKDMITRGKNAALDSEYLPLTEAAKAKLREGVDESYVDFVNKVAAARGKKYDEIHAVAQGRVWMGSQAKRAGLVDETGGLDRAIEILKKKAKIPESDRVNVVVYPPRRTVLEAWLQKSQESALAQPLRRLAKLFPPQVWSKGGMMRAMPLVFEIR